MRFFAAGGAHEHGRNCFLVQADEVSFLVDCGLLAETGGTPNLTKEEIVALNWVFLTHSHADHAGALPWLYDEGFKGTVIATQETLGQLSFLLPSARDIVEFVEEESRLSIEWGRSGHCMGSCWYRFDIDGKSLLFTGDYTENTQVYTTDFIREQSVDLAVIDCAYGKTDTNYKDACNTIINETKRLLEEYPIVFFPVPKYGRGMELLSLFMKNGLDMDYYADAHFLFELVRMQQSSFWGNFAADANMVSAYRGQKRGIVFISNPQLRTQKTKTLADEILATNGFAMLTGTVEKDTYSDELLKSNRAIKLTYPVHLNYEQAKTLESENDCKRVVYYHSEEFSCQGEIVF